MELKEFLTKNEIDLPNLVFSLCKEGITIMRKSIDPLHNEKHLFRLLADLDRFLEKNSQIDKSEIDFKVLLLATCWHDTWKSKRFPTNKVSLIFDEMREGLESAYMFTKRANEVKLELKLTILVKYAIRKHSHFQLFLSKTLEAKMLRDIDSLDEWSEEKLDSLKKIYLVPGQINPRLLKLAKFWFGHFMTKKTESSFHFEWSKAEFIKRKKLYFEEVNKLIIDYRDILSFYRLKVGPLK